MITLTLGFIISGKGPKYRRFRVRNNLLSPAGIEPRFLGRPGRCPHDLPTDVTGLSQISVAMLIYLTLPAFWLYCVVVNMYTAC